MCEFSIDYSGPATPLIEKARNGITGLGGIFSGDEGSGSFSIQSPVGKVEGSYTVRGQTIHMVVSEKPFFISCEQIEAQLRKSLATN